MRPGVNLVNLAHAYVLADKYGLQALQNKIARPMMRGVISEEWFSSSAIDEAVGLMPTNCPLRWIVLEKVIMMMTREHSASGDWQNFATLARSPSIFADLMECFEIFKDDEDGFPPHYYVNCDDEQMKKYLVEEAVEEVEKL